MAIQDQIQMLLENFTNNFISLKAFVQTHEVSFTPLAIFIAMLLLIKLVHLKNKPAKKQYPKSSASNPSRRILTSEDIKMVAGDDLITTQLDLARAYIEMEKKHLAKSILLNVEKQGQPEQQAKARELLKSI